MLFIDTRFRALPDVINCNHATTVDARLSICYYKVESGNFALLGAIFAVM